MEHLYNAKGMKAAHAQAQRRYAAQKKETDTPQNAAKHKEENVQRQKRYQAKMREKQQTEAVCDVEKRRAKIWKGCTNVNKKEEDGNTS